MDRVRCIWTPGIESKSTSTLSFGLSSCLDAAARRFDAALVLNIANGYFLPLLRATGTAVVVNTDGIEWERGKWGTIARRAFYTGAQLSARHADVLVSDSKAIGEIWRSEFGIQPRFVPYGADVQDNPGDDLVRAAGIVPGSYVLVVARLIPENNVEPTLDTLVGEDARAPAVTVGSAGYGAPIEDRRRRLDQQGVIRWLGRVDDQRLLTQLWANCGVYVHGHSVGGTNPALLQALGAGAPTLALDTPFNREVLASDEQLYPPDHTVLRRRLFQIICDQDRRALWSAIGKNIIESRYRWSSVIDEYELVLREAIKRRQLW
ncbi:MAG: DUF1972 domain-containing protein [Solirubrobacteraceae bacterium]